MLPVTRVPSYQVFTLSGMATFNELGPVGSLQLFGVIDNPSTRSRPLRAALPRSGSPTTSAARTRRSSTHSGACIASVCE